ncbi:MAG: HAMP domain-containing protein, partial [Rhodospirillales bacterium]|nr:HAMP domain-containing protein [Rhodospirillales bacterium]
VSPRGGEVLRSINPVTNKEACTRCHGPVGESSVNGVLLVDYDAGALRHAAARTALMLIGSGGLVLLATIAGTWWMLRRFVLTPVHRLQEASRLLAGGNLDARVDLFGPDELAQLGRGFDDMAASLKQSMMRVREQEAFLQALIDAVPDGIRVLDSEFTILKANTAYCRMHGLTMAEAVGQRCYCSSHRRAEPCPPTLVTCPVIDVPKTCEAVKAVHMHILAGGEPLHVEVHAAPLRMPDGRVLVVESIRDLAADIKFSHEQKLAALGQLAAGVAHEIRNPLASVRLALQATLRNGESGAVSIEDLYKYLRLVDGQVDKCIDVTDRLLRLSVNAGDALQVVPLTPAVKETVSLLAYEAQSKGITVTTDLGGEPLQVLATDSELRMVVLNMVQNAFHAMPEGGTLGILVRAVGDRIEVIFEDSGVGIPTEDLPRIFDPFFSHRADGSMGTGLGLTICRSIVERFSGTVAVTSKPGSGARFTVRFPRPGSEILGTRA